MKNIKDLYLYACLSESGKNQLFRRLKSLYIISAKDEMILQNFIYINNEEKFFRYIDKLQKK